MLTLLQQRLAQRFPAGSKRPAGLTWPEVEARLRAHARALQTVQDMEATGGAPEVVGLDADTGALLVCDCAAESPLGRRSLCYDRAALDARKADKPASSAVEQATAMGLVLLDEAQYRWLQQVAGPFDTKTSSWIATPDELRALGGALFCDHRYGRVFTYHNGASSYYAARGFRGLLRV